MRECIFLRVCFLKVLGLVLSNRDTYLSSQKKKKGVNFFVTVTERGVPFLLSGVLDANSEWE